jgi:hypothetical protein
MDDRLPCPHCGEEIARIARKCKHCGEYRDASVTGVDPAAGMIMAFALGAVLVALACVVTGISTAIVGPSAAKVRRDTNELGAITALQAIRDAEETFLESAAEPKSYGALGDLAGTTLLEPDLASGLQDQYVFEVGVSSAFPGERWMATATPLSPGKSGEHYFAINHTGAIYFRQGQPFQLDLNRCEFPPDAHPIGMLNQFR